MKKLLISLTLLLVTGLSMASQAGAGGAGPAAYQEKIAVTRDGKRMPISGTVFEELRSGLFANFLCLHLPKESLLAKRFQNFERGLLTTVDTHKLWHDLAAAWDSLTLTGGHDFPLDIIDAHTLETLFTLAHHPEEFQRIWASCSITQQIQLYDAADFLALHSPLRTAIINATAHIIPAIEQLSKDEFLALLPQLRSMVTHCLPARCALAYQFVFNGVQPHSTQLPIAEPIRSFEIAPDGTVAYITYDNRLYLYNPTTGTSTLIRDRVDYFHFAPDGTLCLLANDGHLLHYNFTHGLDTVQQLILFFVLSHERAGKSITFTQQEIDDLQEGVYYIIAAQRTGTTMAQLLSRSPGAIAQSYLSPTSGFCNSTPALVNTLRNHLLKRIPPPPPEAQQPTAEQLREERGLKRSLLDMPDNLRAHVRIYHSPTTVTGILKSLLQLFWR